MTAVDSIDQTAPFDGPLIAIGASAGGLDPLEAFFTAAPTDAGWCFVVIQHLSPDYRSVMDELLARRSSLTITHIEDGMALAANTIFLNPPNSLVRLDGDHFRLTPYQPTDKLPHLPIDAFFFSMRARVGPPPVAVVVSGSGSDGARGTAAVQRSGGLVIVQSPKEAKFSSMPRAALAEGAVDRVLDASEMPAAIASLLERSNGSDGNGGSNAEPMDPETAILHLLESEHRIDFSVYKSPTVMRRIERRKELRGISSIAEYRDLLSSDTEALEELYHDMLIGVTEFYRDPEALASLRRNVLIPLVEGADPSRGLRIWVAACASGEEAYTLAIELSEVMLELDRQIDFRIIATDVHRRSIQRAAAGIYPVESIEKLPEDLRERYFVDHRDGVAVDPSIRQQIIFSVHDALRDPPFMRLDLISCRNLMIYLDDAAQAHLLGMFQFGLRKQGHLYLGGSESIGARDEDFATVDSKSRIFRKLRDRGRLESPILNSALTDRPMRREIDDLPLVKPSRPPLTSVDSGQGPRRDRDALLRGYDALLKRYAPSSILVSSDGMVLTWFGAASGYVDTMSNLADWTVEDIVHPNLQYPINVAIERIKQGEEKTFERRVKIDADTEGAHEVMLKVEPIGQGPGGNRFLLAAITRLDGTAIAAEDGAEILRSDESGDEAVLAARIRELDRDLRLTEESLQYVTERLEASGEELQASNEELQASNEELQASNEEMQSSNEELHAVNEELVSVSAEHERKITQLSNLIHDTEVILDILRVGAIVLDAKLRVRRFTGLCRDAFELQEHDIGRRIASVGTRPDFVAPEELAERALATRKPQEATGQFAGGSLRLRALAFSPVEGTDARGVVLLYDGDLIDAAASRKGTGEGS
ncbi:CheR family methyltransferase [Sulfitobacter sp. HNIBRBA3233]|uniref:CheR family methyltransferase n=1 Tax=Sulfitobacter marinivivus TaxID=3158558 RepID=UPI0032DEE087